MRLLLLLLLLGCSSPKAKIESNETSYAVDSILQQSQKSFVAVDSVGKESDKFINSKVTKTVQQISTLKQEVKTLKAENNALKIKLNDAVDAGKPFKLLPVLSNSENNR